MFNNNNNNNSLNTFMNLLSMGNNPNQIISNIINQNPNLQVPLNQMQQSGLTPKDYVLQFARQNNIDLNPYFSVLNNLGIKL